MRLQGDGEGERQGDEESAALTPTQMAKIVVVFPEVDRLVQKQIRKALQRQNRAFDDDL